MYNTVRKQKTLETNLKSEEIMNFYITLTIFYTPYFKLTYKPFQAVYNIFTLQPSMAVGVLFSPMVSGWAGGKKFVRAVSQKP